MFNDAILQPSQGARPDLTGIMTWTPKPTIGMMGIAQVGRGGRE